MNNQNQQRLTFIVCNDLGAITRGRGFPEKDTEKYIKNGIGWVPANQSITPFDGIGANPFNAIGDLRINADTNADFTVSNLLDGGDLRFLIGNICDLEGNKWDCCPRSFLIKALEDFKNETGFEINAAFEHEFSLLNDEDKDYGLGFSLQAYCEVEGFANDLFNSLETANILPEMFLPEFGKLQFEVTTKPSKAVNAADRAVALREIVRMAAKKHQYRASFTPKLTPDGVGNGVHIHLSMLDKNGVPVMYDKDRPGCMSEIAGHFAGGVLRHSKALTALTAPSVMSYYRLQPHQWSNAYSSFGLQNREAMLRICPAPTPNHDPVKSHHIEFRTPDATVSPYLALGVLIRAGLEGIREKIKQPPLLNTDADSLTEEERVNMQIHRLPTSLPEALQALKDDDVVNSWFSEDFMTVYHGMKEMEMEQLKDLDENVIYSKYAKAY